MYDYENSFCILQYFVLILVEKPRLSLATVSSEVK